MSDDDRLRVQSLAAEIAAMAENFPMHRRDIAVAAKTMIECADPSAGEETAELVIRLSPYVPSADRVELRDGTLVKGVKAIEINDRHGERREAKITIAGLPVLGQSELRPQA
jgi:hypothetical protein